MGWFGNDSKVVSKKTSVVRGGSTNGVVAKDTTTRYSDGCSKTVRQQATSSPFGGVDAGRVTSVTQNRSKNHR